MTYNWDRFAKRNEALWRPFVMCLTFEGRAGLVRWKRLRAGQRLRRESTDHDNEAMVSRAASDCSMSSRHGMWRGVNVTPVHGQTSPLLGT